MSTDPAQRAVPPAGDPTDPADPGGTGGTGATDGHQDVGSQDEAIPPPQLDPEQVDVADIVERAAPAGGDDDANA